MGDNMTIREYLGRHARDEFLPGDFQTQVRAGWYDWFCRDTSLAAKTRKLTAKLRQVLRADAGKRIDVDGTYVFFKNNCPLAGSLYDDFRVCDLKTGDVVFTVTPSSGHDSTFGRSELWGSENCFERALTAGTWRDVLDWFRRPKA